MLLGVRRSLAFLDCHRSESRNPIAPGLHRFWVTLSGLLHLSTEPLAFSLVSSSFGLLLGKGGEHFARTGHTQFYHSPHQPPDSRKSFIFCSRVFQKHCLPLHTEDTKPTYLNGAAAILKPQISQSKSRANVHLCLPQANIPQTKGAWRLAAWGGGGNNSKRKQKCHSKERVLFSKN